jgi:hypothetical protein
MVWLSVQRGQLVYKTISSHHQDYFELDVRISLMSGSLDYKIKQSLYLNEEFILYLLPPISNSLRSAGEKGLQSSITQKELDSIYWTYSSLIIIKSD